MRGQGEEPTILLTIGLSIFLANTALLIVGTAPLKVVVAVCQQAADSWARSCITQSRLVLVAICAVADPRAPIS